MSRFLNATNRRHTFCVQFHRCDCHGGVGGDGGDDDGNLWELQITKIYYLSNNIQNTFQVHKQCETTQKKKNKQTRE